MLFFVSPVFLRPSAAIDTRSSAILNLIRKDSIAFLFRQIDFCFFFFFISSSSFLLFLHLLFFFFKWPRGRRTRQMVSNSPFMRCKGLVINLMGRRFFYSQNNYSRFDVPVDFDEFFWWNKFGRSVCQETILCSLKDFSTRVRVYTIILLFFSYYLFIWFNHLSRLFVSSPILVSEVFFCHVFLFWFHAYDGFFFFYY